MLPHASDIAASNAVAQVALQVRLTQRRTLPLRTLTSGNMLDNLRMSTNAAEWPLVTASPPPKRHEPSKPIAWANNTQAAPIQHMGVNHRRPHIGMPE